MIRALEDDVDGVNRQLRAAQDLNNAEQEVQLLSQLLEFKKELCRLKGRAQDEAVGKGVLVVMRRPTLPGGEQAPFSAQPAPLLAVRL
jgi:hypothetical protein